MNSIFKFYFALVLLALIVGVAGYLLVSAIRLFWKAYRIQTRPTWVDNLVRTDMFGRARPQSEVENSVAQRIATPIVEAQRSKQRDSEILLLGDDQVSVVGDATMRSMPRSDKEWSEFNEPAYLRRPQKDFVWV